MEPLIRSRVGAVGCAAVAIAILAFLGFVFALSQVYEQPGISWAQLYIADVSLLAPPLIGAALVVLITDPRIRRFSLVMSLVLLAACWLAMVIYFGAPW